MSTQPKTKLSRLRRVLRDVRAAILDAAVAEHAQADKEAILEGEKDFVDRLPELLPHFDVGDVKYSDARFRYF